MLNAMASGQVVVFQLDRWKKGHRATRYSKWAAANTPYMAQYEEVHLPFLRESSCCVVALCPARKGVSVIVRLCTSSCPVLKQV